MTIIIMLGAPGCGKGTQAKKLSKELGLPHISTGDLFRENIKNQTELGKKVQAYIDAGKLGPDELVLDMLFDRVAKPDCANGYILDGFPRTIPQAEKLDEHLGNHEKVIVLNLDCSDESVVKRISGRLSCSSCGAVYNSYFSPPKEEHICDICSSQLIQRADDRAEVVLERLKVYKKQTEPLIEFYEKKNLLHNIQGENTPDVVYRDLIATIKA